MTRRLLISIGIASVLTISIAIAGVLSMGGCGCQQTAFRELPAPDGNYVAIERESDCGATDPYGTAIWVQIQQPRLGVSWLGYEKKRVFVADVALTDIRVRWLDDHNLEITCKDSVCVKYGIAERVDKWKSVKIHFILGKAKRGQL